LRRWLDASAHSGDNDWSEVLPMTEAEWRISDNPYNLLEFLFAATSERKVRLLAVACCREDARVMGHDRSRRTVEWMDRMIHGLASANDPDEPSDDNHDYLDAVNYCIGVFTAGDVEAAVWAIMWTVEAINQIDPSSASDRQRAQATLIRDIFGNPFRPVSVDPAWRTSTVVSLAQGIYDERAFDRLPILADALEDAGCTDADMLNHCRQPGEHVRGCWALDLLLGKQ
jgi:hypothetical protein